MFTTIFHKGCQLYSENTENYLRFTSFKDIEAGFLNIFSVIEKLGHRLHLRIPTVLMILYIEIYMTISMKRTVQ